jgi:hypothetical protein
MDLVPKSVARMKLADRVVEMMLGRYVMPRRVCALANWGSKSITLR